MCLAGFSTGVGSSGFGFGGSGQKRRGSTRVRPGLFVVYLHYFTIILPSFSTLLRCSLTTTFIVGTRVQHPLLPFPLPLAQHPQWPYPNITRNGSQTSPSYSGASLTSGWQVPLPVGLLRLDELVPCEIRLDSCICRLLRQHASFSY